MIETKKCTKCKKVCIKDTGFYYNRNTIDKLSSWCKLCSCSVSRRKTVAIEDATTLKKCSKCLVEKPRTFNFFTKNSHCVDGFVGVCKPCLREQVNPCRRAKLVQLKTKIFQYYTKGKMSCACCGERNFKFLTIDHIDGIPTQEKEESKAKGRKISHGMRLYYKLVREGFPSGFQILCFNCNSGKGIYGVCPHKTEAKVKANKATI